MRMCSARGVMMLSCWLVWAGCDGKQEGTGTGTGTGAPATGEQCDAMAARMALMMAGQLLPEAVAEQPAEVQQKTDAGRAVLAEACRLDRWSGALARCLLEATPASDCTSLLSGEQMASLQHRVMKAFAPAASP